MNSWMPFRTDTAYKTPQRSSQTGTGFGCSDDSDNVDIILMIPVSFEEDETATEGLLPIIQSMEQSTERVIEESESEQSIDRAQESRSGLHYLHVRVDDR
jgi:hypothetical protein